MLHLPHLGDQIGVVHDLREGAAAGQDHVRAPGARAEASEDGVTAVRSREGTPNTGTTKRLRTQNTSRPVGEVRDRMSSNPPTKGSLHSPQRTVEDVFEGHGSCVLTEGFCVNLQ